MSEILPFSRKLDPDELHRIFADTDYREETPYLTFGDALRDPTFMFFLGGTIGCLVTVGAAFVWAWWLL